MDAKYWSGAARSLARHVRHTPGFARDLALSGVRADIEPNAPVVGLLDAYPVLESVEVDMGVVAYRRSNLDPLEQYALAAITRLRQPRRIFEIGTYDGATTLLLARNAPDAEIFTLDLPPETATAATVDHEVVNAQHGAGHRFHHTPEQERITQLFGDSRTFDFTSWHGSIDLVLVDAGHEYEPAKADTGTALRLLGPAGVAVWDDYQVGWPGVVAAVQEAGVPIFRIENTDFAVYDRKAA